MNKKYVIANWKMNMDLVTVKTWVDSFIGVGEQLPLKGNTEVVVSPTCIHIPQVGQRLKEFGVKIAAQDVAAYDKGAHTGEAGAFQLKEFCTYCIVGHSERDEIKDDVLKKRDLCLTYDIVPIVCFVEVSDALNLYTKGALLAWEDPENISKDGVFNPKKPADIERSIEKIKEQLPEEAPVLYGGSVNRQNVYNLVNIPKLDGVLVGSASTDFGHFADLIRAYEVSKY